jgi:hypothetical protein
MAAVLACGFAAPRRDGASLRDSGLRGHQPLPPNRDLSVAASRSARAEPRQRKPTGCVMSNGKEAGVLRSEFRDRGRKERCRALRGARSFLRTELLA